MSDHGKTTSGPPIILLIGGPNGAGKTTVSRAVIAEHLGVSCFVNADVIASGLAGFDPEGAAYVAGRIMLERLHDLADKRVSFAFESTLASRSFAPWIRRLIETGYQFHLVYVWLDSAERSVERVAIRVRKGGHHVDPDTVKRRYARSASNFFKLYAPLATSWRVYDNSLGQPALLAQRHAGSVETVLRPSRFRRFQEIGYGRQDDDAIQGPRDSDP